MMQISGLQCLVLGSAAGGGFPQWNCACRLCRLARAGDPAARPRTQVSVAVSANGSDWLVVGASPDLRQQIMDNAAMHPRHGTRDTPIIGIVLVSADIDGIAGLLVVREQQNLSVYAPMATLDILAANPVFGVLDPTRVQRIAVQPEQPIDCGAGMTLTLLPMPGKTPLYHEAIGDTQPQAAPTYAAQVQGGGRTVIIAPGCARITPGVLTHLQGADAIFFDATLYTDDEMVTAGAGTKTGKRMGHVAVSGEHGSCAMLGHLPARKIYIHINNTNPLLLDGSPEQRAVRAAGFEVAFDGMEISV